MKPIYTDAKAALEGLVTDNMTIAAGGFGLTSSARPRPCPGGGSASRAGSRRWSLKP